MGYAARRNKTVKPTDIEKARPMWLVNGSTGEVHEVQVLRLDDGHIRCLTEIPWVKGELGDPEIGWYEDFMEAYNTGKDIKAGRR